MAERNDDSYSEHQRYRRPPRTQRGGRPPFTRGGYHHHNEPIIRDLREVLNRKRQEKQEAGHAPPDPSYNFLYDPSREGADGKRFPIRGRGGRGGRGRDIESPKNIKIEVTLATGEHVYTMDESITLPTIKHIPDVRPKFYNNRGRGISRGRGRGGPIRGQPRGGGRYNTRTINRSRPNRDVAVNKEEENRPNIVEPDENWDEDLITATTALTLTGEHHGKEEVEHTEEHELEHEEEHEYDEHYEEEHYEEGHQDEAAKEEPTDVKGEVDLQNLNEKITIHVGEQERKIEIQDELKKLEVKD